MAQAADRIVRRTARAAAGHGARPRRAGSSVGQLLATGADARQPAAKKKGACGPFVHVEVGEGHPDGLASAALEKPFAVRVGRVADRRDDGGDASGAGQLLVGGERVAARGRRWGLGARGARERGERREADQPARSHVDALRWCWRRLVLGRLVLAEVLAVGACPGASSAVTVTSSVTASSSELGVRSFSHLQTWPSRMK
jgi:hypothetical protein